jgi:threonine 3-dehydrogenase
MPGVAYPGEKILRTAADGDVAGKVRRILVTGSSGQIGNELVPALRTMFGSQNVIASDVKSASADVMNGGPFVYVDVTKAEGLNRTVLEENIDYVVHLASLLSVIGERNPQLAIQVNVQGIQNILECARLNNLRVLAPSTIAVFGESTPGVGELGVKTPDLCTMRPTTIYGVTKVYLELLGEYYSSKYGVDFRSIRYPGIISNKTLPGGGTTDYAVDIFYSAIRDGKYNCFLDHDTVLPMMYMPDAVKAAVELLTAPRESLSQHTYNIAAFSFTPEELAEKISLKLPHFECTYDVDFRQGIADSWPKVLDDHKAREDWGWDPSFKLDDMVDDMLSTLSATDLNDNEIK